MDQINISNPFLTKKSSQSGQKNKFRQSNTYKHIKKQKIKKADMVFDFRVQNKIEQMMQQNS